MSKKQYIIDNEKLMSEWDWESNEKLNLNPRTITIHSEKRACWICESGHKWQTSVSHRTDGTGCPYCSGRLAIQGETDLATVNPTLAAEWHPTKNGGLTPHDVKAQSNKKVWWLCAKGHEYEAQIKNRHHGIGCPVCWNESHTSFPEQAIFFYLSQYCTAKSREIVCGKEIDIYLPNLKCGIEYDGTYFHSSDYAKDKELNKDIVLNLNGIRMFHVKESNDNYVVGQTIYYVYNQKHSNLNWVIQSLLNAIGIIADNIDVANDMSQIYEQYICREKERSLANKCPELSKEWNYSKNGKLTPDMVGHASNKIVWWICEEQHEWRSSIANRSHGNGCPYCSGIMAWPGYNDLQTLHPEIAAEWDYDNNGDLLPTLVRPKSGKKVWWKCPLGHQYNARVCNRVNGKGCPYCAGRKVLDGFNDLQTVDPDLAAEWNYQRNGALLPSMFTKGSHQKVWWRCKECGHEWEAAINNRYKGRGCPVCANKKRSLSRIKLPEGA